MPDRGLSPDDIDGSAVLQICSAAFASLEEALGVYLTDLLHSDQIQDLSAATTIKRALYAFRRAASKSHPVDVVHGFRALVCCLFAHQADHQRHNQLLDPANLEAELRLLVRALRRQWGGGGSDGESLELADPAWTAAEAGACRDAALSVSDCIGSSDSERESDAQPQVVAHDDDPVARRVAFDSARGRPKVVVERRLSNASLRQELLSPRLRSVVVG